MFTSREWKELESTMSGRIMYEMPLAPLTSFGIGGTAAVLARPESIEEVSLLVSRCQALKIPFFVLGGGTNTLFSDQGFPGLIIKLGQGFREIVKEGERGLIVGAAALSSETLAAAAQWELSGFECLAGIPGTLGGAVMMNAGAGAGAVCDTLTRLVYLDVSGQTREIGRDGLDIGYRKMRGLPKKAVLLRAVFELQPGQRADIHDRAQAILQQRSGSQPKGYRSAGCVFKNPVGDSAGRLIDRCGFKGYSIGGAKVSEMHANFIVNTGHATCQNILDLAELIKTSVARHFGAELELEIQVIGPVAKNVGDLQNYEN